MATLEHKRFEALLAKLGQDFDQKVLDDPDFAGDIPPNANLVFKLDLEQLQGAALEEAKAFNIWSQELSDLNHEEGQRKVTVTLHLHQFVDHQDKRHRITPRAIGQAVRDFELVTA